MGRATDRFLAEIRRSHRVVSYVDLISPNGETQRLKAVDGGVNVDRQAQYRRTATIACIDPTGALLPDGTTGIALPFGTELRPYRGVRYDDGTEEVMPLGVFRLTDTSIDETVQGGIGYKLEATDRSWVVGGDRFCTPYVIPAGTLIVDAIKLLIRRTLPDVRFDAISSPLTTTGPLVFDAADDPWDAAYTLATSVGCEVYFDVLGKVVIAPPVDIAAAAVPDFTYIEGSGCTMTSLAKKYSAKPGYNGVIVTGQSMSDEKPPVRAEAWDTDPSSPTYYLGPYGRRPEFITDSNVKTTADAQAVADSALRLHLGVPVQLTITASVNSALEAGDVIEVERQRMNATGLYSLVSFTVPLKKDGAQSLIVTQKRRA